MRHRGPKYLLWIGLSSNTVPSSILQADLLSADTKSFFLSFSFLLWTLTTNSQVLPCVFCSSPVSFSAPDRMKGELNPNRSTTLIPSNTGLDVSKWGYYIIKWFLFLWAPMQNRTTWGFNKSLVRPEVFLIPKQYFTLHSFRRQMSVCLSVYACVSVCVCICVCTLF